jgi:hypothetical protein
LAPEPHRSPHACIHHTDATGRIDGWIIDRTLSGCADRALLGGQGALSMQLAAMHRDGTARRGVTKLGAGWTMIAGEGVHDDQRDCARLYEVNRAYCEIADYSQPAWRCSGLAT